MRPLLSIALATSIASIPRGVHAQDTIPYPIASHLTVTVDGRVTAQTGDRISINYKLTNLGASQQSPWQLLIRAALPIPSYELHSPLGWHPSRGVDDDSAVVHWVTFEDARFVAPGHSLDGFAVSADGVLGVVQAWAQGYFDLPPVDEGSVLARPPSIYANSFSTHTIGQTATPPGSTVASLVTRLQGLVDQSCGPLGWITSTGLCATLAGELSGSPVQLAAFRDSLNANRTTGAVLADNPYYLLKSNRDYIRSLITSASFQLVYVCGNTFTAKSRVNLALPAHYTVNDTVEAGALVLPAKPSNAEWSSTHFHTANHGTVRLLYDGVVERTLTPNYTACP